MRWGSSRSSRRSSAVVVEKSWVVLIKVILMIIIKRIIIKRIIIKMNIISSTMTLEVIIGGKGGKSKQKKQHSSSG